MNYCRNFIVQKKPPKNCNCHAVEKCLVRLSFFSLSILKASIFQGYGLTNANHMSLYISTENLYFISVLLSVSSLGI